MAQRRSKLVGTVILRQMLTDADRETMWQLFESCYVDISREAFFKDLDEKPELILLRDLREGRIRGFCTLLSLTGTMDGKPYIAVFTGDTVIDQAYTGQSALPWTFGKYMLQVKIRNPHASVYWFLISKGYKTYLFMTRYVANCWPRYGQSIPEFESKVLDSLARQRFGTQWDPHTGIVKFEYSSGRVRDGIAPILPADLANPDIRYFAERNPGHPAGHELCCLGRIDGKFITGYLGIITRKFLRSSTRSRRMQA